MNTSQPRPPSGLPPDCHTHTYLCQHATGTPAEFHEAAGTRALAGLCFTDHSPEPSGYDPRHRMRPEQFPTYLADIRALQDGRQPPVWLGIEADYFPGGEAFVRDWLPRQPFDFVLGSVHYIRDWGFDNPDYRKTWESVDVKGVWREYFALLRTLVGMRLFDAVSHFDLPKKFGHRLRDRDLKEMAQPVLDSIAGAGMAIEINTSGWRRDVNEAYPAPLVLELAREREVPITFGSDAHSPAEVGYEFARAVRLAREAGYASSLHFKGRQATAIPLPS